MNRETKRRAKAPAWRLGGGGYLSKTAGSRSRSRNGAFGRMAGAALCCAIVLAALTVHLWRGSPKSPVIGPSAAASSSNLQAAHQSLPLVRRPLSALHLTNLKLPSRLQVPSHPNPASPNPGLPPDLRSRAVQMYAALPMSFEANAGQSDPRVKFLAHAPGYSLFLTDQEAVLSLEQPPLTREQLRAGDPAHIAKAPQPKRVGQAVRMKFVGGNAAPAIAGSDELPAKSNYFIGNDPKQWHTNVPNYSGVEYRGIYAGVDAVFHGDNRKLEFDFDIAAGADPRSIALEVDGAPKMRLNRAGDLVLGMDATHELVMSKPHVYQQLPEGRREIAGNFVLGALNRIRFALGPYDHTQPLVIDPTLAYSTYLDSGGTTQGEGTIADAVAVDNASLSTTPQGEPVDCSAGCAVVTGTVWPSTLPFPTTTGSYDPGPAPATIGWYGFISKLNPDGSGLVYSTYFGGEYEGGGSDQIFAIAVDSTGAAYFGGTSGSYDDTPTTPGSFMPGRPSEYPVPFVSKLSPDGSTLVYSTFLDGGTRGYEDGVSGIAVDSSFSAYVIGATSATDFPTTTGAFQTVFGASVDLGTGFVTKFSPDGSSLVYSTFLGGNTGENVVTKAGGAGGAGGAIAVDSLGFAYVTGNTFSSNFPTTTGAYSTTCNTPCGEAYVTKLNQTGTGLVYSTFLGGTQKNKESTGLSIALDSSNSAFVGGETSFTDFPVTSPVVQSSPGVGFITKLTPDATGLVYSSYFNGNVESVAVGADDSAVIFGLSNTSYGFESTAGAFTLPVCTTNGGCPFDFISKLTADGTGLIFSTPIGANQECCGAFGALDSTGNAYIVGSTSSTQLSTTAGSYEPSLPSNSSAPAFFYAAKVAFSESSSPITISPSTLPYGFQGASYFESFTATGGSGAGYTWSVTSGTALSAVGLSLTQAGIISGSPNASEIAAPFTVQVTDSAGNSATQNYTLTIYPDFSVTPTTLPTGTQGVPYSQTLTASGGSGGPYSFSVASGTALSAVGLSLSPAGLISGTPNATETAAPVTIQVTDSLGDHANLPYSLTINPVGAPLTISPATLPAATAGTPYSQTLTATGGSGTGYSWTITSGSATLGDFGMILTPEGVIIGSPVTGQVNFTVQVTDSLGDMATKNYTLTIDGTAGQLATVKDNETIAVIDTESFIDIVDSETITVSDGVSANPINTLGVAPAVGPAAWYSTSGLGFDGTSGETQTLTVSNVGDAPFVFSGAPQISSSSFTISQTACSNGATSLPTTLPSGSACTLTILYTPISGAAATGTIVFTDNAALSSPPSAELSSHYTQTISLDSAGSSAAPLGPPPGMPVINETIAVNDAVVVTTNLNITTAASAPYGFVGVPYTPIALFTASGGLKPYTWSASGLPPGLGINAGTGAISGTPTAEGDFLVAVTVTDSLGNSVFSSSPLTVFQPLAITSPSSLPNADLNVSYSVTFSASGGSGGYSWTAAGLPAGLTMSTGGELSGKPTVAGVSTVTVTVKDSAGNTKSVIFPLAVASPSLKIAANPSSLTIIQGQTGKTTLTFTPSGDYTGTLALGCSGLSANMLCVFTQNGASVSSVTLTGNNQSVDVVLTFETDVNAQQARRESGPTTPRADAILSAVAFWWPGSVLGLIALRRRRKMFAKNQRWFGLCLFVLIIGAVIGLAGCGGGGPVTPVGSSTVTVTATPGSGTAQTLSIGITITQQ